MRADGMARTHFSPDRALPLAARCLTHRDVPQAAYGGISRVVMTTTFAGICRKPPSRHGTRAHRR